MQNKEKIIILSRQLKKKKGRNSGEKIGLQSTYEELKLGKTNG